MPRFATFIRSACTAMAAITVISCQPLNRNSTLELRAQNGRGIIGGSDAQGDESFAATTVGLYNLAEQSLCSASILSDSTLLTAGHCVDGAATDLVVLFGIDLESESVITRPVIDFKASSIWPLRQTELTNSGDIAIVKFTGGLPPGYRAVELLTDGAALTNGADVQLAGYGVTDNQTHLGAGRLRSVMTTIREAHYSLSEVAIEQSQNRGSCHGDSGGPAFVTVDGQLKQFGLTSRGVDDPDDTCKIAASYTNLIYYANWIRATQAAFVETP